MDRIEEIARMIRFAVVEYKKQQTAGSFLESLEDCLKTIPELNTPQPLSFRDQAAIAAMNMLIPLAHKMAVEMEISVPDRLKSLAEDSFAIADAMEVERVKRSTKDHIMGDEK